VYDQINVDLSCDCVSSSIFSLIAEGTILKEDYVQSELEAAAAAPI